MNSKRVGPSVRLVPIWNEEEGQGVAYLDDYSSRNGAECSGRRGNGDKEGSGVGVKAGTEREREKKREKRKKRGWEDG